VEDGVESEYGQSVTEAGAKSVPEKILRVVRPNF
jgi:hypothetical protein